MTKFMTVALIMGQLIGWSDLMAKDIVETPCETVQPKPKPMPRTVWI